jgi:hypothetical protein
VAGTRGIDGSTSPDWSRSLDAEWLSNEDPSHRDVNVCRDPADESDLDLNESERSSAAPVASRSAGETNADRTAGRPIKVYAEAGTTASGDSVFAGAALLKGRDDRTGVQVDVFTCSVQAGGQLEAQFGLARIGASSDDGRHSIGLDVFTGKASMGVHNTDGSFGWNAGVTGVAVGVEGTTAIGTGSSLTAGASIGLGVEGSVGWRDVDGDKQPELCTRVVYAWWTLGGCLEMPFTAPELSPSTDAKTTQK